VRSYLQSLLTLAVVCLPLWAAAQPADMLPTPAPDAESVPAPNMSEYELPQSAVRDHELPHESPYEGPGFEMCECETPLFESTGTWLRRGFWYTEIDAVVLNRFWNRDSYLLAGDANSLQTNGVFGRSLVLDGKKPGAEGSARLALGRFLFRDTQNRDHQLEFNVFGGGEYVDACNVTSTTPNGLFVNNFFSIGNEDLSGASAMDVEYSSRFNSFELNYRVRGRAKADHMQLDPTGTWTRVMAPQRTKHFLAGIRYFELEEAIDWTANDVLVNMVNETGQYDVETSNRLIGMQMGGGVVFERDRWSLDVGGKAGVYMNHAEANARFNLTNNPGVAFDSSADNFGLSFVGEYQMVARWHLRPNVSLRAGWQMLYVSSVALAPHQMDFAPLGGKVVETGDPFYNGAIFGFEGYW
jgi:hypothetical protein